MSKKPLSDFEPEMKVKGTVTRTELYGAFVDIGAERDGLVHISMLKKGNVKRVEDVVEVGDEVEVWVHRVDPEADRLELSMLKPVDLKWKDIEPGMTLQGKVVRLEGFGAFVDVGAERPGLVHVSELSTEYVNKPSDVVSVGDQVEVRVLDVDRKKRQIKLTMKEEIEEVYEEEPEPEEEIPTAMEVALRRAMEESEAEAGNGSRTPQSPNRKKEQDEEREEILLRTLQNRMETESSSKKK
ncbi:MAG: S1 RNA-binding domain-containing protein [Anaerolineales bacterium]|nr:S1 RNA-binding domain-containing protein [Anaerolineales bacterium]